MMMMYFQKIQRADPQLDLIRPVSGNDQLRRISSAVRKVVKAASSDGSAKPGNTFCVEADNYKKWIQR